MAKSIGWDCSKLLMLSSKSDSRMVVWVHVHNTQQLYYIMANLFALVYIEIEYMKIYW